ncbi:hypothetical protein EON83_04455 [bacterium]|nr:MAG: hypothetical protein EON83_04455 [bacterium]
MKPWYWEMERGGWGPHFYLRCRFAPENAPYLHRRLVELLPEEFDVEEQNDEDEFSEQVAVTSEAVVWGKEYNSEGGFVFVTLNGTALEVEHGWGAQGAEDTILLVELLRDSQLELQHWSVNAGGDGYNPQYARSGPGAQSLLQYLMEPAPETDWDCVEEELKNSLARHNPCEKYSMRECLVASDGETLRAVLLYDAPRSGEGPAWECFPEWEELIVIAREVGERCGVPYSAASASAYTPEDQQQLIGGSMTFGIGSGR